MGEGDTAARAPRAWDPSSGGAAAAALPSQDGCGHGVRRRKGGTVAAVAAVMSTAAVAVAIGRGGKGGKV